MDEGAALSQAEALTKTYICLECNKERSIVRVGPVPERCPTCRRQVESVRAMTKRIREGKATKWDLLSRDARDAIGVAQAPGHHLGAAQRVE